VGYLTESMHGAGSPQAQRIQIARSMQLEFKKELAKVLAGVGDASRQTISDDVSTYMARVFAPVDGRTGNCPPKDKAREDKTESVDPGRQS
jgi:4-hydroxybutyryl-CoA dehydratase/vinylacetyl-CoA-Delta-isomerase